MFPLSNKYGTDLLSIDLNRGRDHGLPPYVNILALLHKGAPITTFEDLSPYMTVENIELLRNTYESVQDVDLLTGAMLETPMTDTLLGPTAQMVFMRQFRRLKTSDPYFYTKVIVNPNPFTSAQLQQIKKANTNLLFCLNSGVGWVPKDPSVAPASSVDLVACDSMERMSFEAWRDAAPDSCVC